MISLLFSAIIIFITLAAIVWDYRESAKAYRAVFIFISGLLLLGYHLQPQWWLSDQSEIVLLTPGSNFFAETGQPSGTSVVYSVESRENVSPEKSAWFSSIEMLSHRLEAGQGVRIHGFGTAEMLPGQFQWSDRLSNPGPGLMLCEAPGQVTVGEEFAISGEWVGADSQDSLIVYRDGGLVASVKPDDAGEFMFVDQLWAEGPVHYDLEWSGADTVFSEPLNMRVVSPEPLQIAVLLYSPTFEISYLAEMLAKGGHSLSLRTRVGKDRYRFDKINNPPQNPEYLPAELSGFDMMILDPREYAELSSTHRRELIESVQNGLDLLLMPSVSDGLNHWTDAITDLTGLQVSVQPLSRLEPRQWNPFDDAVQTRLPLLDLNFSDLDPDIQIISEFEEKVPVSVRIPAEAGSVSTHIFHSTYSWVLRGDAEDYNRFWINYLERIIYVEAPFLEISEAIPVVNRPITVISSDRSITVSNTNRAEDSALPVAFGAGHPLVGTARFWPKNTGWYRVESQRLSRWFYVYREDQWEQSRNILMYRQTQKQISEQPDIVGQDRIPKKDNVPDWIWLIGFLVVQGFLWIEKKLV